MTACRLTISPFVLISYFSRISLGLCVVCRPFYLPHLSPESTMHAKLLPRLMSKLYEYAPVSQSPTDIEDHHSTQYTFTRRLKLRLWSGAIFLTGVIIFLLCHYVVFKKPTSPSPWTGWRDIRYMFVLYSPLIAIVDDSGASYCSVGYNVSGDYPSEKNIIGNPPFPGKPQTNGLNWVSSIAITR